MSSLWGPLQHLSNSSFKYLSHTFIYTNYLSILITIISFFWLIIFKPVSSRKPFAKSSFSFFPFMGLIVFQVALMFSSFRFNGNLFPFNYYIVIGLAIFSYGKAGVIPAIIGACCGLNFWTAIWWFFCLPDSVACKCKNCGAKTFSYKLICPKCNEKLNFEVRSIILRLKRIIRPEVIIVFFIFFIFLLHYSFVKSFGEKFSKQRKKGSFELMVTAPRSFENVIIRHSGKIVGTNSAYLSLEIPCNALTNNLSYEANGKKLVSDYYRLNFKYRKYGVDVFVTDSNSYANVKNILRKLAFIDYDVNKINQIEKLNNEAEATVLMRNSKLTHDNCNRALSKCSEIMFSNYWFSLTQKKRRELFNVYLSNSRISHLAIANIIKKFSNPEWYKVTPVIPFPTNKKTRVYVLSEKETLNKLFSKTPHLSFMTLSYNSPIIRKIGANIFARSKYYYNNDNLKVMSDTLPCWRKNILKLINELIASKKKNNYRLENKIHYYLKYFIQNPNLVSQENLEIIKKILDSGNFQNYVMAIDNPQVWDIVDSSTNMGWHTYNKFFPREIKSSNVVEIFEKMIDKKLSNAMIEDFGSRIKSEKAIKRILKIVNRYPLFLKSIAKGDSINRAEILRRFAEQTTNYNLAAEIILKYPFPDAEKTLKSIQDNCSEENKIKIDSFCKTILLQNN